MSRDNDYPYCDGHVDLVAAVERCSTILDRAVAATDALVEKVQLLAERVARLETRLSLYAALLGTCAGAGGWILGALVAQWIFKK